MTATRVLVVDDDESTVKVVRHALTQEGYEVHSTGDGAEAEALFASVGPSLVILDVVLPGKSGLEIARDLRARSNVPIIMLSARAEEVDRILGLEFGADDYVTKPFSPRELVSRVKGLLRRAGACPADSAPLTVGDIRIDVAARQVTLAGLPVPLTRTEYEILLHLARSPGTAFSRVAIIDALGDSGSLGDERAIDVHVHNIREKLETDPADPQRLLTVRGFGYRLKDA
jgi:DNA-binding response OmpR family regulator